VTRTRTGVAVAAPPSTSPARPCAAGSAHGAAGAARNSAEAAPCATPMFACAPFVLSSRSATPCGTVTAAVFGSSFVPLPARPSTGTPPTLRSDASSDFARAASMRYQAFVAPSSAVTRMLT